LPIELAIDTLLRGRMPNPVSSTQYRLTAAVLIALLVAACGRSGFVEPVAKFEDAASVVIASTRLYVTELNKVEREHYLLRQASTKALVKLPELEAVQVFSQDGLKVRLDALDQLARYGALLSRLATTDAPERITAETESLGEAVQNLGKNVAALGGGEPSAGFTTAAGAAAAVIGQVLGLIAENRAKEALKKAVTDGEQPINMMLAAIGNDIELAYERRRSMLSNLRVVLVDQYNTAQQDGADTSRLRSLAEQIRAHEDRWEIFATANPSSGLDAMQSAHSALLTYARSAGRPTDLGTFVEAMEVFSARARRVGQAVLKLQQM
jgi:hypothetical protein